MARIVSHWERNSYDFCGDDEGRVYQWQMAPNKWVEILGPVVPTAVPVADAPEKVGVWVSVDEWQCLCVGTYRVRHYALDRCYTCGTARPVFATATLTFATK